MSPRICSVCLAIGLHAWAWPSEGHAQTVDLAGPAAYQEHCASCHGADPATFITRVLERNGDILLVKKNVPLQQFLGMHGATDEAEREKLAGFFRTIVPENSPR